MRGRVQGATEWPLCLACDGNLISVLGLAAPLAACPCISIKLFISMISQAECHPGQAYAGGMRCHGYSGTGAISARRRAWCWIPCDHLAGAKWLLGRCWIKRRNIKKGLIIQTCHLQHIQLINKAGTVQLFRVNALSAVHTLSETRQSCHERLHRFDLFDLFCLL